MQRPSVLLINRVYPPIRGASGRVLRDLAQGFAREGWDVTVLTSAPLAAIEDDGLVRVIRLRGPAKPSHALVYAWVWLKLLIKALRLPRADLVVTLTDPPLFVIGGAIVQRFKKCRHMHWCQDLYPDLFPVMGVRLPGFVLAGLKSIGRAAMRRADKIVVVGRCMATRLAQEEGFDPGQIALIPNWPDAELMSGSALRLNAPVHADEASAYDEVANGYRSHENQIKHGPKFRVLYAGNIGRLHPLDTVMAAAELLQETHPEIEFVFVGDGPRNDALARERARRNLDNIRLLPYQPASKLPDLMQSGDVHLISMRKSAAGMAVPVKLYAALAVQRPCIFIGPEGSETAMVIRDFQVGSVVQQGDFEGLAEEIRQMRLSSDKWFAAHEGAKAAGGVFVPAEAIQAWIQRAGDVIAADRG
jgi:glycosyltransferase involved in cell wall biosynthesis